MGQSPNCWQRTVATYVHLIAKYSTNTRTFTIIFNHPRAQGYLVIKFTSACNNEHQEVQVFIKMYIKLTTVTFSG